MRCERKQLIYHTKPIRTGSLKGRVREINVPATSDNMRRHPEGIVRPCGGEIKVDVEIDYGCHEYWSELKIRFVCNRCHREAERSPVLEDERGVPVPLPSDEYELAAFLQKILDLQFPVS